MSKASEYAKLVKLASHVPRGFASKNKTSAAHFSISKNGELWIASGLVSPSDIPALIKWLQETFLD